MTVTPPKLLIFQLSNGQPYGINSHVTSNTHAFVIEIIRSPGHCQTRDLTYGRRRYDRRASILHALFPRMVSLIILMARSLFQLLNNKASKKATLSLVLIFYLMVLLGRAAPTFQHSAFSPERALLRSGLFSPTEQRTCNFAARPVGSQFIYLVMRGTLSC